MNSKAPLWTSRTAVRLALCLVAIGLLGGCATGRPLMPTPVLYLAKAFPPFRDVPPQFQRSEIDVLYVTDRAPQTDDKGALSYGIGGSPAACCAGTPTIASRASSPPCT